jgi:hypothetical protein
MSGDTPFPDMVGVEGLRLGPIRKRGDPALTKEEGTALEAFCSENKLPPEEVSCATMSGPEGSASAILFVVDIKIVRELARKNPTFKKVDEPVFERDGLGHPAAATVRVHRTDRAKGFTRTAFWVERVPLLSEGEDPGAWATDPDRMLAEVAESLALRNAFPQELSQVYTKWDLEEALRDFELAIALAKHEIRQQLEAVRGPNPEDKAQ